MKNNGDLQKFIDENKINAEIIDVPNTRTASLASAVLGIDRNIVAKIIVFVTANRKPVIAIVRGPDKVDHAKLKAAISRKIDRMFV